MSRWWHIAIAILAHICNFFHSKTPPLLRRLPFSWLGGSSGLWARLYGLVGRRWFFLGELPASRRHTWRGPAFDWEAVMHDFRFYEGGVAKRTNQVQDLQGLLLLLLIIIIIIIFFFLDSIKVLFTQVGIWCCKMIHFANTKAGRELQKPRGNSSKKTKDILSLRHSDLRCKISFWGAERLQKLREEISRSLPLFQSKHNLEPQVW